MILRDLYYGESPIIAVYKGLELVYTRNKVHFRPSAAEVDIEAVGELKSLVTVPLSGGESLVAELVGDAKVVQSAAVSSDMPVEIMSYADLYVYLVAACASTEEITLESEAEAQVPTAKPCETETEQVDILTEVESNCPEARPTQATEDITIESSVEMNAPQGAVIPSVVVDDIEITSEVKQGVALSTPVGTVENICVECEATLTILELVKLVDGILYIPFAYEAIQNGNVLEVR